MEREVRKGVREGTMEITVLTLVLLSFFGFFGAITTGCMRPFVPRTNENEITTTTTLVVMMLQRNIVALRYMLWVRVPMPSPLPLS
jgi:hypothetical protein